MKTRLLIQRVHSSWNKSSQSSRAWSGTHELTCVFERRADRPIPIPIPVLDICHLAGDYLKRIYLEQVSFDIVATAQSTVSLNLSGICQNLETFYIWNSYKYDCGGVRLDADCANLQAVLTNCQALQELRIYLKYSYKREALCIAHSLSEIFPGAQRLKRLQLGTFVPVTVDFIQSLQCLSLLEDLKLSVIFRNENDFGGGDLEDISIIAPSLFHLKELFFVAGGISFEATGRFITEMLQNCPNIECLATEIVSYIKCLLFLRLSKAY